MANKTSKKEKIVTSGNVGGSVIVGNHNIVGDHNVNIDAKVGTDLEELTQAFEKIYTAVKGVSDPALRKDVESTVKEIENEIGKGDQANPSRVERWLNFLAQMAPDIKDVVVDTLTNPIKGISTVIAKVISKAKPRA